GEPIREGVIERSRLRGLGNHPPPRQTRRAWRKRRTTRPPRPASATARRGCGARRRPPEPGVSIRERHRPRGLLIGGPSGRQLDDRPHLRDRKSTRLNSSHVKISYAVFCLKKKIIKLIPKKFFN